VNSKIKAIRRYKEKYCIPKNIPNEKCEEMTSKMIQKQVEFLQDASTPKKEVCVPCLILDTFCSVLPTTELRLKCRELGEKVKTGTISGVEAKNILKSMVEPEVLRRAQEKAKEVAKSLGVQQ